MTIAEKLVEAEKAYHELMTGRAAKVYVDQNGERVEYQPANAGRLQAYIEDLKRQLSPCTPVGPLRAWL